MSKRELTIWKTLINIGFRDSMNEEERVQLKILNLQSLYCIITSIFFFIKSFFQSYQDTFQAFICGLLVSLILVLNYWQKLQYAKLFWTLLLSFIIFALLVLYGNQPHSEILFVIPIVNIFILFDSKQARAGLTGFVVVLCLGGLIHNYYYESVFAEAIDVTDIFTLFLITIACVASIINNYTKALRRQLLISETDNQALQDANADLEHFTYMASHNLKTPLRTIMGNIFLMQRKIPKEQALVIEKHTEEIKTSASDMHKLINDIMEYAVFIQNKMTNTESINLHKLTEKIINSVNVSLEKKAVLNYYGQEEINSNLTLVKAILQNLIENGIKYNDAELPIIKIDVSKEKDAFLIIIADNGIGINEEYFHKIFVMFKRLHHNEEYEGTGIGLAMCKRLLNKYNGEIWLESEIGHGTTFFVRIPMIQ